MTMPDPIHLKIYISEPRARHDPVLSFTFFVNNLCVKIEKNFYFSFSFWFPCMLVIENGFK